jgi:hypothetical protein
MPDQRSNRSLTALKAEIDRVQQTVSGLQAYGHACPDAERQLNEMKDKLARSPSKPH